MIILVMSGTRDGTEIITKLSKKNYIIATTTTNHGSQLSSAAGAQEVISQRLSKEDLLNLIKDKNIKLLIDATHPFAVEATKNALNSAKHSGIKYIRFERPSIKIKKDPLIFKTDSFEKASILASKINKGNILHLAGVSNLKEILTYNSPDKVYIRVLPALDSVKECLRLGLKQEHIIGMQGTFSKNFNKALMQEYGVALIITKESGETGGTITKVEAALELGLKVIMVMRPHIKELLNQPVVHHIDELLNSLEKLKLS